MATKKKARLVELVLDFPMFEADISDVSVSVDVPKDQIDNTMVLGMSPAAASLMAGEFDKMAIGHDGDMSIGCQTYSVKSWQDNWLHIATDAGYSEEQAEMLEPWARAFLSLEPIQKKLKADLVALVLKAEEKANEVYAEALAKAKGKAEKDRTAKKTARKAANRKRTPAIKGR